MEYRRIYPPVYIDSKKNIFCCRDRHICLSHGGTEAMADQFCKVRVRYLEPSASDYWNKRHRKQ